MNLYSRKVSRRSILGSTIAALTIVGASSLYSSPAALAKEDAAAEKDAGKEPKKSANGWPIASSADTSEGVWTRAIAGSAATFAVRVGDPETILNHVARRFNYEVRTLDKGDVLGFRPLDQLLAGMSTNLASGTAMQILPGSLPVGSKGGFYGSELQIIRNILADCDGVVTWGGDSHQVDESLFEIASGPHDKKIAALAGKLRSWSERPDSGAGTIPIGA